MSAKVSLSQGVGAVALTPQETLPPATIPYGFVGNWIPPANYGTLVSPPIEVTSSNWPSGGSQGPMIPQFLTNLGQQIGQKFFTFGTYGAPAGIGAGQPGAGYLGNPNDPQNKYGSPGPMDTVNSQVMDENNWDPIEGQPWDELTPPSPIPVPTAAQTKQALVTSINTLVNQLASLP